MPRTVSARSTTSACAARSSWSTPTWASPRRSRARTSTRGTSTPRSRCRSRRGPTVVARNLIDLAEVGMTYQAASGPIEALAGISLSVGAGEFVSLVGPSGCGKSTLLRIVAGLRPATEGAVRVGGNIVRAPIADVGMVFQAPILLKWRSIVQNVLLPAELAGKDVRALRPRAAQLLDMAGL